jgi:HK97 family phage portal protein
MNLLQRMVAGLASGVGLEASARNASDARWWGGGGGQMTQAGQLVTAETGQQLWSVQAVMAALAPISTLPLMVFERLDADRRRVAREHPLFKVLHRKPNGRQTAQEYRDEQERHLAWWRNSYAILHPAADGGPVGELEPVHPSRKTKIERGTDGWIYYTFRNLPPAIGTTTYREDQVHHVRKAPLTPDGLEGLPMWQTGRETLGRALAIEQFGALYFANGGSGGGVLEHPGSFKDKDSERDFLDTWREGGSGLNRHKDRLLKYGVTYKPFTVNNEEAQFLETKKQLGYEVAALWNMPPHRVGMLERATNNNIEQQSIEFVMYALGPDIAATEQALWRDLLIGEEQDRFFVEFNVAGLLRGDIKTRYAAYLQGRQGGWLSIDDIRRFENLDPIGPDKGGEDYTPLAKSPAAAGSEPKDASEEDKTDA